MRYKVVKRANTISVPATDVYCAIPAHVGKVSPSLSAISSALEMANRAK